MKIKFRDVNIGAVQARAVIEITPGVFLNEVTILKKGNDVEIELPQKSFKGKDGKLHYINIISFANKDKEILWKLEIKHEYLKWRKENPQVFIYESKNAKEK